MLNITPFRHTRRGPANAPRIAIVASRDRRAVLKRVLGEQANVVGELMSGARVHLLNDVRPDVVFVDAHSANVNPLLAAEALVRSGAAPQVVIMADTRVGRMAFARAGLSAVHLHDAATVLNDRQRIEAGSLSESSPAAA